MRWIPSEINVAYNGSRRWERLRQNNAPGPTEARKKKTVDAFCYPNSVSPRTKREVVVDWLNPTNDQERQESSYPDNVEDQARKDTVSSVSGETTDRRSQVQRTDAPGEAGSVRQSGGRLCASHGGAAAVCKSSRAQLEAQDQIRRGLLQVCEQHVCFRIRPARRRKDSSGNHRFQPGYGPRHMLPRTRRALQGWAKTEPQRTQPPLPWPLIAAMTLSMLRRGRNRTAAGVLLMFSAYLRPGELLDLQVVDLVAPMPGKAVYSLHLRPAERRGQSAERWKPSARLQEFELVGGGFGEPPQKVHISDQSDLSTAQSALEGCAQISGARGKSRCTVSTTAQWTKPRSLPPTAARFGDQTKRTLGQRLISETLRSPCPHQPGVSLSPSKSSTEMFASREGNCSQGPQTFWSKPVNTAPGRKYVLEIFSGCARLFKACADAGFTSFAYDLLYGSSCNLLVPEVLASIKRFIHKHADNVAMIWFGALCASWSRARRLDGGPPPLRDDDCFLEVGMMPNLTKRDKEKVLEGNALLQVTLDLIDLASSLNLVWVLENPLSSRLWLTPGVKALQRAGAELLRFDYCAYGVPWRKSIGLLHSRFHLLPEPCFSCHPTDGRCEYSRRRHLSLTGTDSNNQRLTLRAQPYPQQLCIGIASQLLRQFGGHLWSGVGVWFFGHCSKLALAFYFSIASTVSFVSIRQKQSLAKQRLRWMSTLAWKQNDPWLALARKW